MSNGILPPTDAGEISELKRRVTDLERKLQEALEEDLRDYITFTFPGSLFPSTSPPIDVIEGARLTQFRVLLDTAPVTGDVDVELLVNDIVVATITMEIGDTKRFAQIDVQLGADSDRIKVRVVDAEGAADMTASVYLN